MTIDEDRQKKFRSLSLDRGVWYEKHIVCDFCGQETRGKIEEKQNAVVCTSCHNELRPLDWGKKRQKRSQDILLRLQRQHLEMKKRHIKRLEKEVVRLEDILEAIPSPK